MDDGKNRGRVAEIEGCGKTSLGPRMELFEMIEILEQSLANLRDYLVPILGETTVDAILRNAVRENRARYKFISSATIKVSEISFSVVRDGEGEVEPGELLCGTLDFMQSIVRLLTELTGDVLTRKVETLAADLENSIMEGEK